MSSMEAQQPGTRHVAWRQGRRLWLGLCRVCCPAGPLGTEPRRHIGTLKFCLEDSEVGNK